MIPVLETVLPVVALALGGWILLSALRNRPPLVLHLGALAAVEVGVLLQTAVVLAQLASGHRPGEPLAFACYVLAALLIPPLAVLWALQERSRWSTAVLGAACLAEALMMVRLGQTWRAGA